MMTTSQVRVNRGGHTVVELLVSVSICSLLLSLIVPAVQSARATARRTTCLNQIRQLGLGVIDFESAHRRLPGGCQSPFPVTRQSFPGGLSAHLELLPHLEMAPAYHSADLMETGVGWYPQGLSVWSNGSGVPDIPLFKCPASTFEQRANAYRFSVGSGQLFNDGGAMSCLCGATPNGKPGIIRGRMERLTDGLSNTALVSERIAGDQQEERFEKYRDVQVVDESHRMLLAMIHRDADELTRICIGGSGEPPSKHHSFAGATWVLAGLANTWYSHVLPPNSRVSDCTVSSPSMSVAVVSARSEHERGVVTGFMDGSARFITDEIDVHVWRSLGSRDDGSP